MLDARQHQKLSDDLLDAFKRAYPELNFVTDFVVVAEVIGDDGKPYLVAEGMHGSTRWKQNGMLKYALENDIDEDGD